MMYFLMPDCIAAEFEYETDVVLSKGGCTAICSSQNGKYTVKRLLSTNPNDYINPDFMPSSVWGTPKTVKSKCPNSKKVGK